MALTPSNMVPLRTTAPEFNLPDAISGKIIQFRALKGKNGTAVVFICNHCPYVIHIRAELVKLLNSYLRKGVGAVAINSNDVQNYPDDSPENMKQLGLRLGFDFPYLFDESQVVAKAYNAACTPDIYLFNADDKLYYRGQFDNSRPGSKNPVTGMDFQTALDNLLALKPPPDPQIPSMGCNIKWKK
ncbi:MAG: thioredoxin family protein [Leptospiraceae bacterium]|nr:thioredoxin family protein [Leptospiraceae bacterium]